MSVDRIQRNFEAIQQQLEQCRRAQISDERAKLILYAAFVDLELEAPGRLLPEVHRLYFAPECPEFSPRTMCSLSNAFTSAFKKLDLFRNPKRRPNWSISGLVLLIDLVHSQAAGFKPLARSSPLRRQPVRHCLWLAGRPEAPGYPPIPS
jgi:hypothetical protein